MDTSTYIYPDADTPLRVDTALPSEVTIVIGGSGNNVFYVRATADFFERLAATSVEAANAIRKAQAEWGAA